MWGGWEGEGQSIYVRQPGTHACRLTGGGQLLLRLLRLLRQHSRDLENVKLGSTPSLPWIQPPGASVHPRRVAGAGGDELAVQPAPGLLARAFTGVVAVGPHARGGLHVSRPPQVAHGPEGRLQAGGGRAGWGLLAWLPCASGRVRAGEGARERGGPRLQPLHQATYPEAAGDIIAGHLHRRLHVPPCSSCTQAGRQPSSSLAGLLGECDDHTSPGVVSFSQ